MYREESTKGKVRFESLRNASAKSSTKALLPVSNKLLIAEELIQRSGEISPSVEGEDKKLHRDLELLAKDGWKLRPGNPLTFAGILLFTFFVFFRPYELIPGAGFLSAGTFIIGLVTLALFVPTQFVTSGSLTVLVAEIKAVLTVAFLALLTIPIARDPGLAWETFNDTFIKAILIFVVLVNVIRTRRQLVSVIWVSLAISFYISLVAIDLYLKGDFRTEGYRVSVDLKGLFANPNDMALHLSTMIPIVVALGAGAKNYAARMVYYLLGLLFILAITVTYSRGGFLALLVAAAVLAWKIGRKNRVKVMVASVVVATAFITFAPGNYGTRILSMVVPGLDASGSRESRKEALIVSVIVTLRNPWGIGMGNSRLATAGNAQTHNAYTQVASELGVMALVAYLIFLINPIRMLRAIERRRFLDSDTSWIYYLSIGLQGALIAFMVASFFASVAYHWYIYYLVAYAVCLRRIYQTEYPPPTSLSGDRHKQLRFSENEP